MFCMVSPLLREQSTARYLQVNFLWHLANAAQSIFPSPPLTSSGRTTLPVTSLCVQLPLTRIVYIARSKSHLQLALQLLCSITFVDALNLWHTHTHTHACMSMIFNVTEQQQLAARLTGLAGQHN